MTTPLHELQFSLRDLCRSIYTFNDAVHAGPNTGILYQPPILELRDSHSYEKSVLDGLTKFRTLCEKELGIIERMLESPSPPDDLPSTNAVYLSGTWDEVLSGEGPLWSINRLYVLPKSYSRILGVERDGRMVGGSEVQVKVDLVCKGGRQWIKVNTIKLSRLISEIRQEEARAYESSSDASASSSSSTISPFQPVNSLTKQAYALIEAARLNPLQSGKVPKVVMRLTRLMDGDMEAGERVEETLECIRRMGVELRLGPVSTEALTQADDLRKARKQTAAVATAPALRISHKVNLDLSLLIALVSDITHATLPLNPVEADARFVPTPKIWKRKVDSGTGEVSSIQLEKAELGAEEHTRALSVQLRQEMEWRLVEELEEKLAEAVRASGASTGAIELWTTVEAKERCLEIVSKIGGDGEKSRAQSLLNLQGKGFWTGSRYEGHKGKLSDLRIKLFTVDSAPDMVEGEAYTFRKALTTTCRTLLNPDLKRFTNHQHIPLESLSLKPLRRIRVRDPSRDSSHASTDSTDNDASDASRRKGRKTKSTPENARIPTAHTTRSMLMGAQYGMTTITANRMSVKQMVRAMGSMEGLEDGFAPSAVAELLVVEPKTLAKIKRCDWVDRTAQTVPQAEIWNVEPRSLAEAMRADKRGSSTDLLDSLQRSAST